MIKYSYVIYLGHRNIILLFFFISAVFEVFGKVVSTFLNAYEYSIQSIHLVTLGKFKLQRNVLNDNSEIS
jgi:hypothetical protein